ncbi:MAG TPA: hypothetical protein VFG35_14950, partial [Actinoplanes sp.]|nr:hypothetical protein [Actinoplanes sp.]
MASLIADLLTFAEIDRADVVATAQADGLYDRIPELLVVEDPARPVAFQPHPAGGGHRVKVAHLDG